MVLLISSFFMIGCEDIETPTGQAIKETVKETDKESAPSEKIVETKTEEKIEEKPSCTDSCSTNGCYGYKFISCEATDNGCKSEVNKGYVKGRCNIVCITDSDCKGNEQCTVNFDCIEKEIVYSMNKDIKVDYLTYEAIKVETFTKMGTSILKKETGGKFVKVYLKITNNAKETKQIFTPRFKVIDKQDRRFDRVADDIFYISDGLEFGKQLQPSLTISGAIVFELPKDSEELKLEISGDWISVTKIIIALSNIKNIGTDTTLKEKQDKMMDEVMEEAESQVEEIMSKCNAPFKCSSGCAAFADVGRKDCPSGQLCCMTEQSEVDKKVDELMEEAKKQTEELLNQCNSPFTCTSSCPDYMGVGQKNCPSGQLCCMQT